MRVIGVFNEDGGTFRTLDMDAFTLLATTVFEAHGHAFEARVVSGRALMDELKRAADETDLLLAGGGDGTISAAAGVAYHRKVKLGVLPAGTMNLFARSLAIPLDLEAALETLAAGEVRAVDIATANGRPFVHQFSVGIHAKLVKLRETLTYRSRWGKMLASVRAFFGAVARPPNFQAELATGRGRERRRTSGISISNNPFGEGHFPHADKLDLGVLGIYIAKPLSTWALMKLFVIVMAGHWRNVPELIEREAKAVSIRFPRKKATAVAVIDGELIRLPRQIDLEIHPGALQVVVPKGSASHDAEPGNATEPAP